MLLVKKAPGRRPTTCQHPRTIKTVNAGLERTVCEVCREVTVAVKAPGDPGTLFRVKRLAD